jgi:MFS transporter, Spinster family, sphingosine-1-phosphate transporter
VIHTEPEGNPYAPPATEPAPAPRAAMVTFAVLFAMNLLDYMDRWTLSGVLVKLQPDLRIDDAQAGSLNIYFLISYSLVSPLMGWAGDRLRRTRLLAMGVGLWSLATVGTGLVQNFDQLRLARSLLGVGEATYGVLAPTLLMDLYPRSKRSRVLSAFYLAMPLGYALGVIAGSRIAEATGNWRLAFFVVGAPGLVAALSALWLPEPIRGTSEGVDPERLRAHERAGASRADYLDLMVNSSYTYVVFGMAAFTFAFGGLAYWLPSYLVRVKGFPQGRAGDLLGITGLFAAIIGMSGGGWLADRLSRKTPRALFLVPGVSMLLAVPFILLGLFARSTPWIVTSLFLAQALMFANTGPCNAVIANVVAPNMRATAYAVSIFALHFLGDVWSPWLMGKVSVLCGQPDTAASGLGRLLAAVGAEPIEGRNLTAGMLVVLPAVLLGGAVLLAGARHLPREMALMLAKLKAAPAKS